MGTRKRLLTLGGVVVTGVGLYSFPGDVLKIVQDVVSAVSANPSGAVAVGLGVLIIGWANSDAIEGALGFGRSPRAWVRQIREWTLEKRKWSLSRSDHDRDSFHIVFAVPMNEKDARNVNVIKPPGVEEVAVTIALTLPEDHKKALAKLSDDERSEMIEDLILSLSARSIEMQVHNDGGKLSRIDMLSVFPADGRLTEEAFFDKVQLLVKAFDSVNVLVGRAARKAKRVGR